jgi:prephenate dehydrogenase
MITEKLKQIDKRLIELLQERKSLIEKQITDFDLAQVTEKQLEAHFPTLPTTIDSDRFKQVTRKVTIVGGKGRMGQFFAQQLTQAGHNVQILGRKDWEQAEQLLAETELVLISVPIEQTLDIIEQTCQYIAPTTAIADLTSIKTEPLTKMLTSHSGAVMGLHPMFGPNIDSFATQKIVVCPGRDDAAFQWLIDLMTFQGGEIIVCQPPEHDRAMAIVQAVRHFSQFGFGIFLTSKQVDLERSLSMASPNYRLEYEAIKRFFQQNSSMYVDIMLATETSRQTIAFLAQTYQNLADLIAKGDRNALIQTFISTQNLWKNKVTRNS